MGVFENIGFGFAVALTLQNISLCFIGCLVGTLIGVLPGVGPLATIAMLLPLTFGLDPTAAIIMLAGIYYGAQYGGSTAAILLNIPGEVTSVVTTLDGYQMSRQGKAGRALAIAAIGSFVAGSVSTLLIAGFAQPLTGLALQFGPTENFSLMVMGLVFALVLAGGSLLKAACMTVLGILMSTVGVDIETARERLTFGYDGFANGIDFTVLAMGVFGFAEIVRNLASKETRTPMQAKVGTLLPDRQELRQSAGPIVRGTFLGSLLGVLPGGGAALAPFVSYTVEKKISAQPAVSARAPSKAWQDPRQRTMPGRRHPSFRCLRWESPPRPSWLS
jgi:putative tricarboxylic transport membrane protein